MTVGKRFWRFAVVGWAMMSAAAVAGLSPGEMKMLADATSHMAKLDANLKLAQDTAGPGEGVPAGSKARLAMTRLDSARQAGAQVSARLEKLPADDAAVKGLQARYDAAVAEMQKLEDRLTGKSAPPPADAPSAPAEKPAGAKPAAPAAPAATGKAKLDYRQRQALKDAEFFIREVDGNAGGLEEFVKQVQAAPDPMTINFQNYVQAMSTIENAKKKTQNARSRFESLPADGEGVAEASAELDAAYARVEAAEKVIVPLHDKAKGVVDPGSYPEAKADFDRLREITQMFYDPQVFQTNRPAATAAVRQLGPAAEEHQRILKAYQPIIVQQTEMGRQFEGAGKYFAEKHAAFASEAERQKGALPGEITSDLQKINEMADDAVKNQRPAWFTNGIPDQIGYAVEKIDLLEALDPSAAANSRTELDALKVQLKEKEASLADSIIAANDLPPDRYTGPDRAELVNLAIAAWKEVQPDAEILKERIPRQEWKRATEWRWSSSRWYKVDHSSIQVRLVVKLDDKRAAIRSVNLWKNHLEGDKITTDRLESTADAPAPLFIMLLEKVK